MRIDNNLFRCGIYVLRFGDSNKVYVGETGCCLINRYLSHIDMLRNNRHFSRELQCDYFKYGESKLCLYIAEYVENEASPTELAKKESFWIKFFDDKKEFILLNKRKNIKKVRGSDHKGKRYDLVEIKNTKNGRRLITTIISGDIKSYRTNFNKKLLDQKGNIRILNDWRLFGKCFKMKVIKKNLLWIDVTKEYYAKAESMTEDDYNSFYKNEIVFKELDEKSFLAI